MLIQTKFRDQVVKDETRNNENIGVKIFASFLVILSGFILFADKVSNFGLTNSYAFQDVQTFIWIITQTLSPLILCLGGLLRPYKLSYTAPVYIYFIQLYWVFNASKLGLDDVLLHVYALGFTIIVFIVVLLISLLFSFIKSMDRLRIHNLTTSLRNYIVFMYKDAEEKDLIRPEKSTDFRRIRLELTDKAIENE